MQENEKVIREINASDYYRSLTKKEKGKFLSFLCVEYGMNVFTTSKKLTNSGGMTLNKLETIAVTNTIIEETWKK